jgi:predicted transcriptional regulator
MKNQKDLIERTHTMIDELNIKATKFCDAVKISHSTLYAWWRGRLVLSDATAERIDSYLRRYNF